MITKYNKYIILSVIVLVICVLILLQFAKNKHIYSEAMSDRYTAVIVEPREHAALEYVLQNALDNLEENWDVHIFHGIKNKQFVVDIIDNKLSAFKDRIVLQNMYVENLSIEEYNRLMTSIDFYEKIPTETMLVFQTDSIICEECKEYVNEFLQYDYVGAPNKEWVGNGGFSLRKKSKMIDVLKTDKRAEGENEDVFFTKKEHKLFMPDIETANRFSNEGNYSPNSFGVHKPWWYFTKPDLHKKQKHCKALKRLIELN
jgi:hypothetical protein|uniref:DUF5672 domain-containing protein n=1 Tax=viral metagenome TaxID=1070528 RepID=A0A6C0IPE7_9ZZZZ